MTETGKPAQADRLSDFERAVSYYSIPHLVHPLTLGLIVAYFVCLLEAVVALLVGVVWEKTFLVQIGAWASIGMILFGIVIFVARALINEFRQRRALAVAGGMPNAASSPDMPDPFETHMLLKRPRLRQGKSLDVTDNQGNIVYSVEVEGRTWTVRGADGEVVASICALTRGHSFFLDEYAPSSLTVTAEDREVARLSRRFSFKAPRVVVECSWPEPMTYLIDRRAVYHEDRLVGRIYYVRRQLYLDIEREHFCPALLAFFVTLP